MSDLKVYIVTLKSRDDLDDFYEDMETPGGNLYIPNRAVEVADRRPISRSTHYYLTDDEAQTVRNDSRVLSVELNFQDSGIIARPAYIQQSTSWDKSSTNDSDMNNWGLLRCYLGQQYTNWGSNGTPAISGTIEINQSGYSVDVVIVDGHFDPQLSELQINNDGTGGTRVNQYNWFQHNDPPAMYSYTPYVDPADPELTANNNHGAHVAGIAAGNSQGWARNATIYNISPYDPAITTTVFDYIRAWHASKPINPATGRKNPTILNNSWALFYTVTTASVTQVRYRGNLNYEPFTNSQLNNFGIFPVGSNVYVPARSTAIDADIQDCVLDGMIVVGAAGNDSMNIANPGEEDYINYLISSGFAYYYNIGSSPGSSKGDNINVPGSITVGAIDTTITERKASYSNCGTRVQVYAPGSNIISCLNSSSGSAVVDPRGVGYFGKKNGTSMATPQVTGVLACLLQVYPDINQEQAIEYLNSICKQNQILNTLPATPSDVLSLQGSPNVYLAYKNERNASEDIYPNNNYWLRPTSGAVWPRTNYRKS
jgi:subtilisin family serine protease